MTVRVLQRVHWIAVLCLVTAVTCDAPAQDRSQTQPGGRQPRPAALQAPVPKPAPVPKQLWGILRDWEKASDTIQNLSGNHHRIVYDLVFHVEKHAEGRFYYEKPDKGRIDIEEVEIDKGKQGQRKDKNGKPFQLRTDRPEKWICDGKRILQINDREKTADVFTIPEAGRGVNIMHGPLPFLFGMPAAEAVQRYRLKVLALNKEEVWLEAQPNWKQDAANWKQAKIILRRSNFLPRAVQLIDPTGNAETVYLFSNLALNKRQIPFLKILGRDWYNPNLRDYSITTKSAEKPQLARQRQPANPQAAIVPSLVGLHFKQADQILKRKGLKSRFVKGQAARAPQQVYVVARQKPAAGSELKKGTPVTLTLFDKTVAQAGQPGTANRK